MRRAASQDSQPKLKHFQEDDDEDVVELEQEEEEEESEEEEQFTIKRKSLRDADSISNQLTTSMTLHKPETKKPYEELFCYEKYGAWRHEQRIVAAKLKKELKARWAIQKLIEQQLNRFESHYNRAGVPTKMSDVAQMLMPKWVPPHEVAAVFWLGDWRPSTILDFLRSLAHTLWDPVGVDRALTQLINDVRIEEAVIDEEMAEIQSNCVLHLPFGPNREGLGPPLARVRSEFRKIHRVIAKAQKLRMKALEVAVKKVLSQTDAAEFLVAFVGVQDVIHEFCTKYKARKGPVCINVN